ncbi:NADPH:quinone reductase [Planctomicrobium sp. SH664]|uniref:NADPH:quinone reductase n=1 Tax=Planctomicrobium sp. SH664 TaxID=3448125 RepID=UPI003F5BEB6C
MKAAFIQEQGPPDVLKSGEIPTPEVGPRQVLVRIKAASVNPIDTYIRSGMIPAPITFPYVPGCDFAGVVEQVGPEVTRFRPGDRVWGSNQGLQGRQGTLAEFIAPDEAWVYPTPAAMTDEQAAAGALTGITAHLGLFLHGGLKSGEWLFINGGTGGVGSMVIQFAKAAGAKVIATAGSEEKRQLCQELGADFVFDYKSPTLDDDLRAVLKNHGGLDFWWETQREPNLPRTISFLKKRGRIIVMAGRQAQPQFPLGQFYTNDLKLIGFAMFNASAEEQRHCAEEMNAWFEGGDWKPLIGARFPLSEAAAAHRLQEESTLQQQGRLTGKIIVLP